MQRACGLLCLVLLAPGAYSSAYSSGTSKPGLYAAGLHVVQSCSAPCPVALLAHSCTGACTAASRHSGAEGFSWGCVVVARANSAPGESASQVQPQYCSASLRSLVFLHWQPYSKNRSSLSAFLVMKLIWKLSSFQKAFELFGLLKSHFQAVFSYLNSTFEKANPMSQDYPKITC